MAFRMSIDHAEVITGRGTMVTGRIVQGQVRTGDPVVIVAKSAEPVPSVVTAVVTSGKSVASATAGDTVGVLLRGVKLEAAAKGNVLQSP
jgi:elongation factor Tu